MYNQVNASHPKQIAKMDDGRQRAFRHLMRITAAACAASEDDQERALWEQVYGEIQRLEANPLGMLRDSIEKRDATKHQRMAYELINRHERKIGQGLLLGPHKFVTDIVRPRLIACLPNHPVVGAAGDDIFLLTIGSQAIQVPQR